MSKIRQEKTLSLWQAERDQAHERLEKASKLNGAEMHVCKLPSQRS